MKLPRILLILILGTALGCIAVPHGVGAAKKAPAGNPDEGRSPAAMSKGDHALAVSDDPADAENPDEKYQVGVGDKLIIELYNKLNKKEFDTEVSVDDTGYIILPQIKKVKVIGLTLSQLNTILESRFSEIMYDPVIIVKIGEFRSKKIHVLGKVRTPGPIVMKYNSIKLLEAIANAGGLDPDASGLLRIIRGNEDAELVINLTDISDKGKLELNIDLLPGDTVIALTNDEVIYVMGEVHDAGEYPWKPGMTVLEAIATAGGFTEDASKGRTKIFRKANGDSKKIKVNPENIKHQIVLDPGDIVKVPKRIF